MRHFSRCCVIPAAALVALIGLATALPRPEFDEFMLRKARIQEHTARIQEEASRGEGAHNQAYLEQRELSSAQIAAYFRNGGFDSAAIEEAKIQADKEQRLSAKLNAETSDKAVAMDGEVVGNGGDYLPAELEEKNRDVQETGSVQSKHTSGRSNKENAVAMDGGNGGDYLPAELEVFDSGTETSSQEGAKLTIQTDDAAAGDNEGVPLNVLKALYTDRDQTEGDVPKGITLYVAQPAPQIQAVKSGSQGGSDGAATASAQDTTQKQAPSGKKGFVLYWKTSGGSDNQQVRTQGDSNGEHFSNTGSESLLHGFVVLDTETGDSGSNTETSTDPQSDLRAFLVPMT